MKDIDNKLETVLRGLRHAEPHASLEMRIELALRGSPTAAKGNPWFVSWPLASGIAAGAVVCAVIAGVLLRTPHVKPMRDVAQGSRSIEQRIAVRPTPDVSDPAKEKRRPAFAVSSHAVAEAHPDEANAAQTASFPAPPMPLTEQERLLIRLAHRDDPVQLAQLGAGPRDARYQAEKDQVSEFFMPPVTIDQPDTNLTESGGGTQ